MSRNVWLIIALLVLAVIILVTFSTGAFAQDGSTVVQLGPMIDDLLAAGVQILVAVLLGVALWIARLLPPAIRAIAEAKIREIEARHRQAIESALLTGINEAAERLGVDLATASIDVKSQLAAEGVRWTLGPGAREAVQFFGITTDDLAKKALALIGIERSGHVVAGTQDIA